MTQPSSFSAVCEADGQRLDVFVASRWPDISRSHGQRLIRDGNVRVNGQPARPSARLGRGDLVEVSIPTALPTEVEAQSLPLNVVYEDAQVVVVDKPPGFTVHPAPGHPRGTLVNALLARYPEVAGVGGKLRPGIVHRLDADTSGLMVVARTPRAYLDLTRQIRDRAITKVYLALVRGHPAPPQGIIQAPVGRDPRNRQRMAVIARGLPATTEYRTLRRFQGFALLELRPQTGRTHQIRVHLSAIGHPVAGDARYGGRVPFLGRQFLHAHRLGFRTPPEDAYVEFTSPLPPDLEEALRFLDSSG